MDDEELFRQVQEKKNRKGSNLVHQFTRREEANALIKLIGNNLLSDDDSRFYDGMLFQMRDQSYEPSIRQIFWLRDIKDRTL